MKSTNLYLAGLGWSTIFGLSFLVTKGALEAFSPVLLLFLRFALASAALGLLAAFGFVKLSFRGKPVMPLVLICLFQPILYFTCETYGIRETASSTAGLILGALPAAVAALSVPMLKERLAARQALGLALSISGVILIVMAGGKPADGVALSGAAAPDTLRGILLIMVALASAAFYNVYSRRASVHYSPAETTLAMMATGAAFFGVMAFIEGVSGSTGGWSAMFAKATPAAWGAVAYLGILSSVVAFFLVNLSLSRLKASQSSVFGTITTLVSLVAGIAFRGESFGSAQALGAVGIVGGVWLTNARCKGAVA